MSKDLKIFTIIPEGKYKGKRLYNENLFGGEHLLPCELNAFFKNALNNNYKILVLNCVPNHNIKINLNDLVFLNKAFDIYRDQEEIYKYTFPKDIIKIKELQYFDIKKLYDLSVEKNKVGSLFINPFLKNNLYCFNICLVVTEDFDLNKLLKFDFNLIKINSINDCTDTDNLILEFFKNLYNLDNTLFKDCIVSTRELSKTYPYDRLELPERKAYNEYFNLYVNFINDNPGANTEYMDKNLEVLKEK